MKYLAILFIFIGSVAFSQENVSGEYTHWADESGIYHSPINFIVEDAGGGDLFIEIQSNCDTTYLPIDKYKINKGSVEFFIEENDENIDKVVVYNGHTMVYYTDKSKSEKFLKFFNK